jgi:hypothetical protein
MPPFWWCDPSVAAAAQDAPNVRHIRDLMRAISAECDRHGTRLVVRIIGPVH